MNLPFSGCVLISGYRKVKGYEDLVNNIKRAWSIHVPNVTLEDALAALDDRQPERTTTQSIPQFSSSVNTVLHSEVIDAQSVSCPGSAQSDPGDYEFDESHDFDELIDGMGFLTAEPCRSGYTGPTSGVAALRLLRSLPTENHAADETVSGHLGQSPLIDVSMSEFVDVDALINDYFLLYHPAYPLLHEGLFRARVLGKVFEVFQAHVQLTMLQALCQSRGMGHGICYITWSSR